MKFMRLNKLARIDKIGEIENHVFYVRWIMAVKD